ncbi:MAG: glucose 1-dehydrogenase, partial [Phreatobacter sp.]
MRVVLITGATGGIGRALCRQFADAGDRVVAVDLDPAGVAALAAELGPAHRGHACDIASEAAVVRLIADIGGDLGRLDVVVNNAAIGPTMTATAAMSVAAIRQTLAVNLAGPFLLAREAARFMAPRGGGVIVNTASLAGILPNPKRNAYAASKAGVISLTRALANEWAGQGIRVCAVAPGYVRTPMVADLERDGLADLMSVRRRIPMGRIGRPDEIAAAIGFLASERARYITGTTLVVDGGWQAFNAAGNAFDAIMVLAEELAPPQAKPAPGVALVTGAARGIGRAIALRLARDGYRLAILDSDAAAVAALAAEMGVPHRGFAVDVTDEAAVMATFETAGREFGRLDLLVNNAAIADSFKPTLDQSRTEFDRILEVNLVGTMLCAREAVRLMTGRGGVIVNLASIAGHLPLSPRNAYSASKAAVIN